MTNIDYSQLIYYSVIPPHLFWDSWNKFGKECPDSFKVSYIFDDDFYEDSAYYRKHNMTLGSQIHFIEDELCKKLFKEKQ